jgi:hypothetical protein
VPSSPGRFSLGQSIDHPAASVPAQRDEFWF